MISDLLHLLQGIFHQANIWRQDAQHGAAVICEQRHIRVISKMYTEYQIQLLILL